MANSDHDGGPGDRAASSGPPVVRAGQGEAAMPGVGNPITFSETPPRYHRPPPTLDEQGDEIRRWLSQPTGAPVPQETAD